MGELVELNGTKSFKRSWVVALQGIRAAKSKARQRSSHEVLYDGRVIDNLVEFFRRLRSLAQLIIFTAVRWIPQFEVETIVVSASRIEPLATSRAARFALYVLMDGDLCPAGATQYCSLVPFALRPNLNRMAGEGLVAILAGVVNGAALRLNRNNVSWAVVMRTPGLGIEIDATHRWRVRTH